MCLNFLKPNNKAPPPERPGDSPGQVPLRVHGHVDEQRAEDEQVRAVVDGVLYQRRLHLPRDGEAAGASVRLHEGQQQPERAHAHSET